MYIRKDTGRRVEVYRMMGDLNEENVLQMAPSWIQEAFPKNHLHFGEENPWQLYAYNGNFSIAVNLGDYLVNNPKGYILCYSPRDFELCFEKAETLVIDEAAAAERFCNALELAEAKAKIRKLEEENTKLRAMLDEQQQ